MEPVEGLAPPLTFRCWFTKPVLSLLNHTGIKLVVIDGSAPTSNGYQPLALLLSYITVKTGADDR